MQTSSIHPFIILFFRKNGKYLARKNEFEEFEGYTLYVIYYKLVINYGNLSQQIVMAGVLMTSLMILMRMMRYEFQKLFLSITCTLHFE